jgi:hypothetical protein
MTFISENAAVMRVIFDAIEPGRGESGSGVSVDRQQ